MTPILPKLARIACALVILAACGDGGTEPSGSVQVTVTTTGRVLDRDGYTISIDGAAPVTVPIDKTLTLSGIAPGEHTVTFGGVAENCQAPAGTSHRIEVVAGGSAAVRFAVQCMANRLAYWHRERPLDPFTLYVRRVDGTGARPLGVTASLTRIDWSADGYRIAYVVVSNEYAKIWVADVDSGTSRAVNPAGIRSASQPTWAPHGSRIAFTGVPAAHNWSAIYTMEADGSGLRQLTPDGTYNIMPAWSPDGSRIAYINDRLDFMDVWVMKADGSERRRLASVGSTGYAQLDWSVDGAHILYSGYSAARSNWDIHSIRPDGTGAANLTNTPFVNERHLTVLPNGQIAYNDLNSNDPFNLDIWIMNADGTGAVNFTNTPAISEILPAWQ